MKELNVLLLGGAKRVSFAEYLKRAAESRGFLFRLYSYELIKEVPISVLGEVVVGLRWKDQNVHQHLCELIHSKNIQMVLPFVDPAIAVASELKKLLPDIYIPCASTEICRIMFDKQLSAEWFESLGVSVPRTYRPNKEPFFPLIAKPRAGSASKGIVVVHNQEELKIFSEEQNISEYLLQYYIEDGQEFTVDAFLSKDKEVISVVPRIRLEQSGGEAVRSITIHDKTVEDLSLKILQTKAFAGPVTIQFIRDPRSGETFIMEINPRYGGAVITSFAAGADTTACLVDEWSCQPLEALTGWKENVLMTRYFKEVIFHADNN
jgi:carbamoyl-phosphate synthase large subunit